MKKHLTKIVWTLHIETDKPPNKDELKSNITLGIDNCPFDVVHQDCKITTTESYN